MITIVNCNIGNVSSIKNMLKKAGHEARIVSSAEELKIATKIILPGVGAFDNAMNQLQKLNLIESLNEKVLSQKIPTLGICLGMQLLGKKSEEGVLPGLGWINAETVRFNLEDKTLRVPHMGWNSVQVTQSNACLAGQDLRFYFVHSYHMVCSDRENVIGETLYGVKFTSAVRSNNIFGVQFHPEKSHRFGMGVLKNFAEL